MSELTLFGLVAVFAAPALLVLAAAGVAAYAATSTIPEVVSAEELERSLHSRLQREQAHALAHYVFASHKLSTAATPLSTLAKGRTSSELITAPTPTLQRQLAGALARTEAINQALAAHTPLLAVAQKWHTSELQQAQHALQQAQQLYHDGSLQEAQGQAQRAEHLLTVATYDAHQRLAQAQRTVVAQTLGETLQRMGYTLRQYADQRGVALWATQGDRTLALVVGESGKTQMDMAGFDGIACRQESERLMTTLREKGIQLRRESVTLHARREGSALIPKATQQARRTRQDIAQALLDVACSSSKTTRQVVPQREQISGTPSQPSYERARKWLWTQYRQQIS